MTGLHISSPRKPNVSFPFPRLRASIKRVTASHPLLALLPILAVYASIPTVIGAGETLADEPQYLAFARNLVHGHYAVHPGWDWLSHGPGVPTLIAPFVAAKAPILATRIFAGAVVLFGAVLVFFKLADRVLERLPALVCAYLFAAYWPFLLQIRAVHNEPLTVFLVVALAHRTAVWSRTRRRRDVVLTALIIACLALTRIEYGYLLIVWIAIAICSLALRQRPDVARYAIASSLLALVLCVPYLAYTQSVTHRLFYWGTSGGQQLYWMDTGLSRDYGNWHSPHEVFSKPGLAPHRLLFNSIEARPPEHWNSELQSVALRNIRKHPLLYVRNLAFNAGRQILNVPYSYDAKQVGAGKVLFYSVANLAVIAAAALGLRAIQRRRQHWPPMVLLLTWFSVSSFCVHAVVASYARMFVPTVPALAAIALYAAPLKYRRHVEEHVTPPQVDA